METAFLWGLLAVSSPEATVFLPPNAGEERVVSNKK